MSSWPKGSAYIENNVHRNLFSPHTAYTSNLLSYIHGNGYRIIINQRIRKLLDVSNIFILYNQYKCIGKFGEKQKLFV